MRRFAPAPASGFTYIGLLILLATIALVAAASVQVGSILQRRAAEEELLQIGLEFRNALQSYANASQAGQKRYPATLQDLLKDPRFPRTVRHLRKIYTDPLTGSDEWGIQEPAEGQGVLAVYSLSKDRPIKVGNFDAIWQGFDAADTYQRWRFGANLQILPRGGVRGSVNPGGSNNTGGEGKAPPGGNTSGITAPPDVPPRRLNEEAQPEGKGNEGG